MAASRIRLCVLLSAALACFLCSFAPASHAVCQPSGIRLGAPTLLTSGNTPLGIAAGDFDGDGITDLVVASNPVNGSSASGAVLFFRGLGTGSTGYGTFSLAFQSPITFPVFDLVAGDFTGDGKLDVVTTNPSSNRVTLFPGNGNGSFGNFTAFDCVGLPHHLASADLNADGALDLVVGMSQVPAVSVLLGHATNGHGDGTFAPATSYTLHNLCTGVAIGDVDGDAVLDIAATEYNSGTVAVLHGQRTDGVPDGQFVAGEHPGAGASPYDVSLADVDQDGHLDLLVANNGASGLVWMRNAGGGLWGAPRTILSGGSVGQSLAGDFDGDGFTDVVATSPSSNQFRLLTGDAQQQFSVRTTQSAPSYPVRIVSADFNSDGLKDFAVTNYNTFYVSVYLTECTAPVAEFRLREIRDVPNDQGGKVWVSWNRHPRDVTFGAITGYRVWRRVPAPGAAARAVRVTRDGAALAYWEAAASLPAQRMATYAYTAATAQDSLPGGNPYTAFFVTATTAMPDSFFDSPVDSGYSVDNLSPAPPLQALATLVPGGTDLAWANVNEPDLYGVLVYRGGDAFFPADEAHLLGTFTGTHWLDGGGEAGHVYKLASLDVHGNRGPLALLRPDGAVAATASLVRADASPGRVTLVWYADPAAIPEAALERSEDQVAWAEIARGSADGTGRLAFTDADVRPGATYSYRLAWTTPEGPARSTIATVAVPRPALALAAANPVPGGALVFAVTLPGGTPAALDVFDVGGRRALHRDLGALAAGEHRVDAGGARLRPGVYLARLGAGGLEVKRRVVIVE